MTLKSQIYTKTGDNGSTSLANGTRVSKHALRIEAYGTVDELNANLGLLKDLLGEIHSESTRQKLHQVKLLIEEQQQHLFVLCTELANPKQNSPTNKTNKIAESHIFQLEKQIDHFTHELPILTNFIIPGGSQYSSQAHISRCICRRAERLATKLREEEPLRDEIVIFLNRLSDWLFTIARTINDTLNVEETIWHSKR